MQILGDYDPDTDLVTVQMGEVVITMTVPQSIILKQEIEGSLYHAYENRDASDDD